MIHEVCVGLGKDEIPEKFWCDVRADGHCAGFANRLA